VYLIANHSSIRAGLLLGAFALILSGCSLLLPSPDAQDPIIEPQLPPSPVIVPTADESVADPAPRPVVVEPVQPDPVVLKVAIVLSGRVPAYENVALELGGLLEDFDIYDLSDRSLTQKDAFDAIQQSGASVVVAVGLRAAKFARAVTDIPVIFSQVFNVSGNELDGENVRGVAAIPPLSMQLEAWRQLNPELRSIGAILGEGHDSLIEEAIHATDANDLHMHYRIAKSDRETLYHFTRLAPVIDGFWLFPDNRILSATVLRQMMEYAGHHGIQVAVFNDSLLSLGAAISTTSIHADVAKSILSIITSAVAGELESVPGITPLSEISVRTNAPVVSQVALEEGEKKQESR